MLPLLLLLAAAPPATSLTLTGFSDDDHAQLTAQLASEIAACAGAAPVTTALPASCDDACLQGVAGSSALVSIEALRVGGDVDVDEKRVVGGAVTATKRTVPFATFQKALLAPATCAALTPPKQEPPPPPPPPTPTPAPDVHPGVWVAGGGALVAVVGLAGFAFDASTLEDPTSTGADKSRAAVTGWVWLGAAVVGVAAGVAGAVWVATDG